MAKYLSFSVNNNMYLFSIDQVHSIIKKPVSEISPLPEAPSFFLGLTQLREKVIAILSASVLFELRHVTKTDEYVIVIIKANNELYGVAVDIVNGVKEINQEKISTSTMMMDVNKYVLGIYNENDDLHLVIDAEKLIEIKQIDNIK